MRPDQPQPFPGMPWRAPTIVAAVVLSLIGIAILVFVLNRNHRPVADVTPRQPGMDRPAGTTTAAEPSPLERGRLIPGTGAPANLPGAWPWFRGPQWQVIAEPQPALARDFGAKGPPALWNVDLGEGYAGAAVRNGRVYVLDYDQKEQGDALRCFSLADGQEIWRYFYPVKTKRNHGFSRTVPAATDKYVVSIGPKCHVICVAAETGQLVWGLDLARDFGTVVPEWYTGQCPVIDVPNVILAPAGDSLLMAVELATGKVVWRTPNPRGWKMTHTSITPMDFAGQRQYIYSASDGIAGIAAADGALLWDSDLWKVQIAACASPVVVGPDLIFFSGGYNTGSLLVRLKEDAGKITPEIVWRLKPTEFGSTQQTPIFYQGYLYGIRPDGQLTCLNLAGKVVWTSGAAEKFGLGPYLLANGLLYVLAEDGRLVVAEVTPAAYRPLSRATVVGHDAWAPMALAGGRLLCRDFTQMVCLDVTGGK